MARPKGYSATQIRLHWIVGALIVLQLVFGEGISTAWDRLKETGVASYDLPTLAHIGGGALILLLGLWRITLRITRGGPEVPVEGRAWTKPASAAVHGVLYLLMIVAPLTGSLAWFGGIEALADPHKLAKPVLIVLILAHVGAALWHQFVLKDGLILRMKRPAD